MGASNLRLILISSTWDSITFHSFNVKVKKIQKLADLWLVGEMVNRIGIYGSKVVEDSNVGLVVVVVVVLRPATFPDIYKMMLFIFRHSIS